MSAITEKARALRPIIEKAVGSLTDNDALKAIALHPKWREGVELTAGERVRFGDKLYKVKQAHTSQADWTPDVAVSLFEEVCETAAGTIDSPIPYDGNMVLEEGKYYAQGGAVYHCFRDTGVAVYHPLTELVGIYVIRVRGEG